MSSPTVGSYICLDALLSGSPDMLSLGMSWDILGPRIWGEEDVSRLSKTPLSV